jgi:hypothetical protein
MSYRSVNFVTNGFSASNYTPAGPFGNQFITPYGDPYRVQAVGGVGSVLGSIATGIGKVITPLLPIATPIAGAAVSSLLNKPSTRPAAQPTNPIDAAAMQTSQAQAAAANAKSDNTVYLFAGGATLLALFYFLSRRK